MVLSEKESRRKQRRKSSRDYLLTLRCVNYKISKEFFFLKGLFLMDNSARFLQQGLNYFRNARYFQAAECFRRASEIDPKNPVIYYHIGNTYLKLVTEEKLHYQNDARTFFEKAVKKGCPLGYFGLGKIFHPDLYPAFASTASSSKAISNYKSYIQSGFEFEDSMEVALNNLGCVYGISLEKFFEAACYTFLSMKAGSFMGKKNYEMFRDFLKPEQTVKIEKLRDFRDAEKLLNNRTGKRGAFQKDIPSDPGTSAVSDSAASEENGYKDDSAPSKDDGHRSLEELMDELNALVGLDEVKSEVRSLINLLQVSRLRRERGMKVIPMSLHLVFTGNPGTGKTTVARLLAGIYRELGVLSEGQLVEVDRSDLVAGYVGQTAVRTKDKINEAKGGILFIDEAYTLVREGNDFGQEAIDTLLKEMEDNRDDFMVIVAGYPGLMERFLNSNPGLRSRFNRFIHFRDYSPEQLIRIFQTMCEKNGYTLSGNTKRIIEEDFGSIAKKQGDHFANGRSVRNYFELAVINQANRLASNLNISNEELEMLKEEDLEPIYNQ